MDAPKSPRPRVTLHAWSNIGHLQQLYTGLAMLHRQRRIKLAQRIIRSQPYQADAALHLRDARLAHAELLVDQGPRIYYDMHDSWEVDEPALDRCDMYFKRSLTPDRFTGRGGAFSKLRPYGLNYEVCADPFDYFGLARSTLSSGARGIATALGWSSGAANLWQYVPNVSRMQERPPAEGERNILFMARTWDPHQSAESLDAERSADRHTINETRAACIRALRSAFGERFLGGFAPTAHAQKAYPDLVLPSEEFTKRKHYLALVRRHAIGIATAGLHGSLGWKLGEYVAFSRAILSERISIQLPGDFTDGLNYLSFSSPEECVERATQLMTDDGLRNSIAQRNHSYYERNLRPTEIIAATLAEALNRDI